LKNELKELADKIAELNKEIDFKETINIMEVCGTHTMAIARYGIQQLLPPDINLISGPGCPVCVTSVQDIDWFLDIIKSQNITAFSFGDLFKVPGTRSSLNIEKSKGKKIKLCYSPLDALEYAFKNSSEEVLFIAIGFETTAPLTSVLIKRANEHAIKNFSIFSTHKIVPPAIAALLDDKNINIDGFLLPGHVAAITGTGPFEFIARKYRVPGVVTGFEAYDVMNAIQNILIQIKNNEPKVEIEYKRVVRKEGNTVALDKMYETFVIEDSSWRGIGKISGSGLGIRNIYSNLDAKKKFPFRDLNSREPEGCICGDILKGIKKPTDCKLFAKKCFPDNPVGPCMVSSEGTCSAYFKYKRPL
jgi:hydrogenase expression/formation protein HypD